MSKNNKGRTFIEAVSNGEEKSVGEWASIMYPHLDGHEGELRIYGMLRYWRRIKGVMIFNVRSDDRPDGKSILRLVSENDKNFYRVYSKRSIETENKIKDTFQIAESLVLHHPKMREQIKNDVNLLFGSFASSQQHFLTLEHVPADTKLIS